MKLEKIKSNTDLEDYFSKMTPEDSAIITTMCINRLARKVKELKELYMQLVKTYGFEMDICGITCIAQISSTVINYVPCSYALGTKEGIKHALLTLTDRVTEQVVDIKKEESNDKE